MQDGATLALEAIRFLAGEAGDATASRVALINNPLDPAAKPSLLERTLSAAQRLPSRRSRIVGEHSQLLSTCRTAWHAWQSEMESP